MTPHRVIAARVRELRRKRGWSAAHLAAEMARVGVGWDRSIVANLESGRRAAVSVEELFALAATLSVAPIHLCVPTVEEVEELTYRVAPGERPISPSYARAWIRGITPIGDPRIYFAEVPAAERIWIGSTDR